MFSKSAVQKSGSPHLTNFQVKKNALWYTLCKEMDDDAASAKDRETKYSYFQHSPITR